MRARSVCAGTTPARAEYARKRAAPRWFEPLVVMAESQQDIDALLAEVNALADEAVASIDGSEEFAPHSQASSASSAAGATATLAPEAETGNAPHGSSQASASASGSAGQSVSRSVKSGRIAGGQPAGALDVNRILSIEVPIIVQLSECNMPLADILNLSTGSIIEFEKPADSELELRVNNKCIGVGQAVKVGENFGLRVVRIGTVRERIQAMAG